MGATQEGDLTLQEARAILLVAQPIETAVSERAIEEWQVSGVLAPGEKVDEQALNCVSCVFLVAQEPARFAQQGRAVTSIAFHGAFTGYSESAWSAEKVQPPVLRFGTA